MDTGKLIDSMKRVVKSELGSYDTTATVRRIEGDTAWVHIPGGVDETPVRLTMNAKEGDNVQVRVSDGKAFLAGNVSAPPTDDTRANQAYTVADIAAGAAENALANATRAREAADRAEGEAVRAGQAADRAEGKADDAAEAADEANKQAVSATNSANNALTQLDTVESVVDTLTWIAEHSAFEPSTDASVVAGKTYYYPCNQILTLTSGTATTNGLTFVTDANAGTVTVSGTATASTVYAVGQPEATAGTDIWFSGVNGGSPSTYQLRYSNGPGSTSINSGVGLSAIRSSGNLYINIFIQSGYTANDVVFTPRVSTANEDFDYEIIENPTGNPSTQGYFELNTDDAVKTYVQTHLALTDEGLWLLPASAGTNKVLIATGAGSTYTTAGTYIIGSSGETLARFAASEAQVGKSSEGNTVLDSSGVSINQNGTTLASFTSSGIVVGQNANGKTRLEATPERLKILYKNNGSDIQGASFGFSNYSGSYYNSFSSLGIRAETAPLYDSTSTYSIGDLCTLNNGILYVCRTNITTPEAWNGAHWKYALGDRSVAEGENCVAAGEGSHAEGELSVSLGDWSHSEGYKTKAVNTYSHAEGNLTTASGGASHAEGLNTKAEESYSHAEGQASAAKGECSHAANSFTIAQGYAQTAIGKYNVAQGTADSAAASDHAFIIGNGTSSSSRSNALTVDWSGNVNIPAGANYMVNGTPIGGGSVTGVKGNSESDYRTGNVNITAANVGAVALADKYTRSSNGTLDWSTQTEGDAKVIAKSALAFWNGAYSGNSSNLSKCSTGNIIGSNGGTMTGQLKTSFKTSVAMGSYGSAQTTVEGLVGEVRFSSGCTGSASINTAYTNSGITIPTGWYNFMYMPHRSGGNSGAADGDNANYGNLFLFGMNNTNGRFIVRVSSGSIADVCRIWTSLETVDYVVEQGTSGIWTYRKWNSGVAECWGIYSASIAVNNSSAAYGGYRSAEITATAYPFTFSTAPVVTATCGAGSNGAQVVNVQGSTVSNCKFYLGSGSSMTAASRSIHIHAIGKWK